MGRRGGWLLKRRRALSGWTLEAPGGPARAEDAFYVTDNPTMFQYLLAYSRAVITPNRLTEPFLLILIVRMALLEAASC